MSSFETLGLAEVLVGAVAAEGYTRPTPIQAKVIPHLIAGDDVLGIAQTGTGKTAAFVLPLLHQMRHDRDRRKPRGGRALILSPTRELALQIAAEIRRYSQGFRVSVAVVVGGVKAGPQIRALSRGVDIIVATPGRLLDHHAAGAVDFSGTTRVVLDEADQMFDLGFIPAIKRIMAAVPQNRQTVLMSATMPPEIRKLAAAYQNEPAEIAVTPVSTPIEEITQRVIAVEAGNKRAALADVLADRDVSRAVVFTRTKHGADKVARHLTALGHGCAAIHGNKTQGQRQRALAAFKAGDTPILVATDIAARGIHVDDVSHVINFELPEVAEVYVHRIGRTARAGRTGVAISLCSPAERKLLRAIDRLTGGTLCEQLPDGGARAKPENTVKGSQAPSRHRPGGPSPRRRKRHRPDATRHPRPAAQQARRKRTKSAASHDA